MALDSDLIAEWTDAVQDGYTLYRKQIDNYPGEGSWPSYASRATTFFGLVRRQFFYEPLRDYDAILAALNYTQMQTEAYLPDHCVDHVQISFSIFEGAGTAPNGRLQMPRSGERKRGLHAVRLVGWDDSGEVLLFRNSWGRGGPGLRQHGSAIRRCLHVRCLADAEC